MLDSGPCDWLVLQLVLPIPTIEFSRSRKRNWKNQKRSDSSDFNSVELIIMTDSAYESDSDSAGN